MFYYSEDIRSVFFVVLNLSLMGFVYVSEPSLSWFFLVPSCGLLCLISCVINHNHMHHITFRHAWANRVFEILLTWARGHTSATIWLPHNANHHTYSGSSRDWITPKHVSHRQDLKSLALYIYRSMATMKRKRKEEETKVPKKIKARQNIQQLFLFSFIAAAVMTNPLNALLAFGLPWFLGASLLVGVNLFQHADCAEGDVITGSRNFTNRFENYIFFNNGYHTVHHLRPTCHWTQLPKLHKEVAKKIPDSLNQGSILIYLLGSLKPNRYILVR